MGSITTGVGLVSGIDTASLIENLLALEGRSRTSLQTQVADLQSQQAALLDINARLLNLKSGAEAFRTDLSFRQSTATSSDETVLTATGRPGARPGSYKFIVKDLVSTNQLLSRGFVDSSVSPVGLSSLSFEVGGGAVTSDTDLAALNGGQGIDRGRITITETSGGSASVTIDLTDVTTVTEVLDRINNNGTVDVTAIVSGDGLAITHNGGAEFTVESRPGDTTAEDLSIAGASASGAIKGAAINAIGGSTSLASLNDGNGVLIKDNVADFTITARNNVSFDVDLGGDFLTDATTLADLNNGSGIGINAVGEPDLRFLLRDGTSYEVDLDPDDTTFTIGDLAQLINDETEGKVNLTIATDNRLEVEDTTDGTDRFRVVEAGNDGAQTANTAQDLGIYLLNGTTASSFVGDSIASRVRVSTIQEVIDRINNADGNDGYVTASIGSDGVSLNLTDETGATTTSLSVTSTAANPFAAAELGIEQTAANPTVTEINGTRLIAGLNSVLLSSLNGGSGLGSATTLTINDRNGASDTFTINPSGSLSDVIRQINTSSAIDVTAGFNRAGNGLSLTDASGGSGNLTVSGDAASVLGLEADVASNSINGANLQKQYVSRSTKLDDLNYGRGVGTGSFVITDVIGNQVEINIDEDDTTLGDVIDEINAQTATDDAGFQVSARINDTGDGLLLETRAGFGGTANQFIRVEADTGSTARDLRILGESDTEENASIDGSYEATISISPSDTLDEIVDAITAADVPVTASVLNTGSGPTPVRLSLASQITGSRGNLVVDTGSFDLQLNELSRGTDAKVFFGADDAEDGFLIRSGTNSLVGVVPGLDIDLLATGDDAVTVTVATDEQAALDAVSNFVTTFNDVIETVGRYDFFDLETESRGVLLGSPTTSRVTQQLYQTVQGRAEGVSSSLQFLSEIGIRVGAEGLLAFDQDQFREAYADNPTAVESLFTVDTTTTTTSDTIDEIAPGVTIINSETTTSGARGFSEIFAALADRLTDPIDGTLSTASDAIDDRIELLTERVEAVDDRLVRRRAQLEREFAAMELALANLQNQSSALLALNSNVSLAGG